MPSLLFSDNRCILILLSFSFELSLFFRYKIFVLFLLFKFIIYLCCMHMYEHIYRNFGLLNESEFMYPRSKWVCLVGIKYQIYYNCRKIYEYLK